MTIWRRGIELGSAGDAKRRSLLDWAWRVRGQEVNASALNVATLLRRAHWQGDCTVATLRAEPSTASGYIAVRSEGTRFLWFVTEHRFHARERFTPS